MIIVKLFSGLGNQMFQYAMGRRLADYHQVPLKLDITWFNNITFPKFLLDQFKIHENIAFNEEIEEIKQSFYFQEINFCFKPDFLNVPKKVYLDGYWQSERYFRGVEPLIREELTLKKPSNMANQRMKQEILGCEAVSVHIRRGDYLTSPIHRVCTMDYYQNCIKLITRIVRKPHFFIFSDDWDWAEKNLKLNYPVSFVKLNHIEDGQEDLRLMSFCRHHIIANSTFSWWGAWLANYPHKIVCAPNKWLNSKEYDTGHVVPESWHQIAI